VLKNIVTVYAFTFIKSLQARQYNINKYSLVVINFFKTNIVWTVGKFNFEKIEFGDIVLGGETIHFYLARRRFQYKVKFGRIAPLLL
jgi:hypothetical protein